MKNNRKPPTFQHLPHPRAKKLKKAWVVKQKTKRKWKAYKRREGILTQRDGSATLSDPLRSPSVTRQERDVSADQVESETHKSDESPQTAPTNKIKQKMHNEDVTSTGNRLRELQKRAYSPAALHHYKSHPLGHSKRRGYHDARVPVSSQRKDIGGSTQDRSRRGGQPNMRLRMSAMLEKIKRDYS
ncbi:hypothetical protein F5148DRAFT_977053 [Russula earlei]|uniref:Uncharacterized protein n=1 Tax=Russula earlei TaxID=71964 RepID=A0ACC0UET5_9AGAM|nr:hypothetical protein F5148DRAFT_977053 [Russula earlei]